MTARLSRKPLRRLMSSMLGQSAKTGQCPDMPLLSGRVALVTGATSGIGKETARGLLQRGADVVMLCRDSDKAETVKHEFMAANLDARLMHFVIADMADLAQMGEAAQEIQNILAARRIDILIENAGIWRKSYAETENGIELTFATNVLGHFALRQTLMQGVLTPQARVIVLTGDIYVMASDCGPDFKWRGLWGGMQAYNRSKLGNFWIARELQRRRRELSVFIVHPGVVATDLNRSGGRLMAWVKRKFLLDAPGGAQTVLMCATQDDVSHGSYYHNVHGEAELNNADPAMNDIAAARLWETCVNLVGNAASHNNPISRVS